MEKSKEKSDEISIKLGYSFFDLLKYFELLESFVFYPNQGKKHLHLFDLESFAREREDFDFIFPGVETGLLGHDR